MISSCDVARSWLGYCEHQSPVDLWSYESNTGKGGYTAIAERLRMLTGKNFQGLPWCATFLCLCFWEAGMGDRIGKPHPGTRKLARRLRRKKKLHGREYIPLPGDVIFCGVFRIGHCGIVIACDGVTVTSIDGNTVDPQGRFKPIEGGVVAERTRLLTDPVIRCYASLH